MPHTYVSDLVHCVFSAKLRRNLIKPEMQSDLWSFLGGVARKNKCKALMVGGTENHIHILLSLSADMPLAKAMQLIKGASSRWMNETHTQEFRLAGGIWCVHDRCLAKGRYDCIHPVAGRASP